MTGEIRYEELINRLHSMHEMSKAGPDTEAIRPIFNDLIKSLDVESSAALQNAERVKELASLNRIGQALSSALEEDEIIQLVFEQTSLLMDTKNFYVAMYDPVEDLVSFPLAFESGEPMEPVGDWRPRKARRGLTEYVIRTKRPLLIKRRAEVWLARHQAEVELHGTPTESWLGVPMIARKEVLGVIAVQHPPLQDGDYQKDTLGKARLFNEDDRNVLSTIASQAAIAIQNARLLRKVRSDLKRRIDELDVLVEIDKMITSGDLKEVLDQIVHAAVKITGAPIVSILLADKDLQTLHVAAYFPPRLPSKAQTVYTIGQHGVSGWVARHKRTARIGDVNAEKWKGIYIGVYSETRSELAAPLLDKDRNLLGVINLESPQIEAFSKEDEQLINALARQAAIAIQNQRRFEEKQETARRLESLGSIDKAISSTLDRDKILRLILNEGLKLLDAPLGYFMLHDRFRGDLFVPVGAPPSCEDLRQPIYGGVIGESLLQRSPLLIPEIDLNSNQRSDPGFIPGARSALFVPLIQKGRPVGVLSVQSPEVDFFDEEDRKLLETLADHANTGIQTADRYEQAEQGRRRLQALHEIDKRIIQEVKDYDKVMETVLQNALELTRASSGELDLYENGVVNAIYSAGRLPGEATRHSVIHAWELGFSEIPHGIIKRVAETKEEYITHGDAQQDPYYKGFPEIHSEVAVPLISQAGELIGVLNLESEAFYAFNEDHLYILKLLAGQAVIAIQVATSYRQAEQASSRFQTLYEAGQMLGQISRPDQIEQAYAIITQMACDYSKSQQVVVRRYDEHNQRMVLKKAIYTETKPPFEEVGLKDGLNGLVFQKRVPINVPDILDPGPGIHIQPSDPTIRSMLVAPILFKDYESEHYYGNLGLAHKEAGYFSGDDVALVQGLAHQLAITIHRLDAIQAMQDLQQQMLEDAVVSTFGQFGAELTHQLKADLGLIKTRTNHIQDELLHLNVESQAIQDHLQNIVRPAERILDFSSRLEIELDQLRSGGALDKAEVPVERYFEKALADLQPWLDKIQVRTEISPDVRPIQANPTQVEIILRNLIKNAEGAMPGGGTLTLSARNSGDFVEIQVADTGVGIPPDYMKNIFNLWFSTRGGYGFGLWISRTSALMNAGKLEVQSTSGEGTTFTLLLPHTGLRGKGLQVGGELVDQQPDSPPTLVA